MGVVAYSCRLNPPWLAKVRTKRLVAERRAEVRMLAVGPVLVDNMIGIVGLELG